LCAPYSGRLPLSSGPAPGHAEAASLHRARQSERAWTRVKGIIAIVTGRPKARRPLRIAGLGEAALRRASLRLHLDRCAVFRRGPGSDDEVTARVLGLAAHQLTDRSDGLDDRRARRLPHRAW